MKKIIKILFVIMSFIILTGCSKEKENINTDNSYPEKEEIRSGVMECNNETQGDNNVTLRVNYRVNFEGEFVKIVNSYEEIISDDRDFLEQYKTQIEAIYLPYKDIKYYNYKIEIVNNSLISRAKINYEKVDTDKMIEIDPSNALLIKNGKIKIDTLKAVYEKLGAICKETSA